MGEEGGINLYGFVGNSPINWVDSWGLTITIFGSNWWHINTPFRLRPFMPRNLPKWTEPLIRNAPKGARGQPPKGRDLLPPKFRPKTFEPDSGPMSPEELQDWTFPPGSFIPPIFLPKPGQSDCNDDPEDKPDDSSDTPGEMAEYCKMVLCA